MVLTTEAPVHAPARSTTPPLPTLYVGIDIGKETHQVAIVPADIMRGPHWKHATTIKVKNTRAHFTQLLTTLQVSGPDQERVAIAIDHTGGHYSAPLYHFLTQAGYQLTYLNPVHVANARSRLLGQDNKTDKLDAHALARLLWIRQELGEPLAIQVIDPHMEGPASIFRTLTSQRWRLTKLQTQLANRLHQLLLATFPEAEAAYFTQLLRAVATYPHPQAILQAGEEELKALGIRAREARGILALARDTVGVPPDTYAPGIQRLAHMYHETQARLAEVDVTLSQELVLHPYSHILLGFPGIGTIGAATLIGAIGDITRYPTRATFRKAMGTYGATKQSGKILSKGNMGKGGSREARRVLYQATMTAVTPNAHPNRMKDYWAKKKAQGWPGKKAVFASAGLMAELIYHCLRTGQPYAYRPAHPEPVQGPPINKEEPHA